MPGPIHGLRFIHAALRAQSDELASACAGLESPSDAQALAPVARMLAKAARGHAAGEDAGYFPTLAQKVGAVVEPFGQDHVEESERLEALEQLVGACASDADLARLREASAEIRDHLDAHMRREEEILWPLTDEHFSPPEQGAIMQAILAGVPRADLPELIPWMVDMQTSDEAVAYVQLLKAVQPPEAFAVATGWIRDRARPERWSELVSRMPELG